MEANPRVVRISSRWRITNDFYLFELPKIRHE